MNSNSFHRVLLKTSIDWINPRKLINVAWRTPANLRPPPPINPIIVAMPDGRQAVTIEPMLPANWPDVRAIYLEGIATGNATFETAAPEWERWDAAHLPVCRLIAREHASAVGWAALSRVSSRQVYSGLAEVSVYVAQSARGRGVGMQLLSALVEASEREGMWTLQGGIFPENHASIRLHQRCGFRIVGTRERAGCLAGVWRDVVLMERRSKSVGL
jgi:L-amino acid N-acyltransferase YncA